MLICDGDGDVTSAMVVWWEQATACHSHPEDGHGAWKPNVDTWLLLGVAP